MERQPSARMMIGDVCIDVRQRVVTIKNVPVEFTCKEFDIFHYLCQHKDWAITKQQMIDALWDISAEVSYHTIENMVYKIRKKIQSSSSVMIHTMIGYGYKLIEKTHE